MRLFFSQEKKSSSCSCVTIVDKQDSPWPWMLPLAHSVNETVRSESYRYRAIEEIPLSAGGSVLRRCASSDPN